MRDALSKYWPLPSPEHRGPWIIPVQFYTKFFDLRKDTDYLCYLSAVVGTMVCLCSLLFVLTSIFLGGGYSENEIIQFPTKFRNATSGPLVLVAIIFYLRIRLAIDMETNEVPINIHPDVLVGYSKFSWISHCSFLIVTTLAATLFFDIPEKMFVHHFHKENAVAFVVILQALVSSALGLCVLTVISSLLSLEKVIRFFPQFQIDMNNKNESWRNR